MVSEACTDVLTLHVTPDQVGTRLDTFLAAQVDDLSRTRASWHILHGHVALSDPKGRLKPGFRLRADTVVSLEVQHVARPDLIAQAMDLDIVHEDAHLLVIAKPAGMVVHPAAGHPDGTLLNGLLHHVPDMATVGDSGRPGLVHRIDKDTSGLLVVSKTALAMQRLAADFAAHRVERRYATICLGRLRSDQLSIDTAYGRHPRDRKRFSGRVEADRRAVTHLEVSARSTLCSLLICSLETGRTHQIRVHLTERGHPIAGDLVYGGLRAQPRTARTIGEIAVLKRLPRMALHAYALGFKHPHTGQRMRLELPWPADLLPTVVGLFGEPIIELPGLEEPVWPATRQPGS